MKFPDKDRPPVPPPEVVERLVDELCGFAEFVQANSDELARVMPKHLMVALNLCGMALTEVLASITKHFLPHLDID